MGSVRRGTQRASAVLAEGMESTRRMTKRKRCAVVLGEPVLLVRTAAPRLASSGECRDRGQEICRNARFRPLSEGYGLGEVRIARLFDVYGPRMPLGGRVPVRSLDETCPRREGRSA